MRRWILLADQKHARILVEDELNALYERDYITRRELVNLQEPTRRWETGKFWLSDELYMGQEDDEYLDEIVSNLASCGEDAQCAGLILIAPEEMLMTIKGRLKREVRQLVLLEIEADIVDEDLVTIKAYMPGFQEEQGKPETKAVFG